MSALDRVAGVVRAGGGLLADAVVRDGGIEDRDGLGAAAASGPRTAAHAEDYAFLVEAIREGELLHYGPGGRVVATADPDLALLGGDRLYALGLARLAALGDLAAVGELADAISLSAQAHAEGRPDAADAVWTACAAAVAHGAGPDLTAAKAAARAGVVGAETLLRASARRAAQRGA